VTFQSKASGAQPAVTIAVAKRKGTNATDVAHRVAAKLDTLKGSLVPADVHLTVTRDYGETAADKSNELLWHMLLAVVSVSALIGLVLGRREAAVVLIAIPVTLALTLFMFYLYGYTLNRITLFALIFSVGILVDDAIVVVENIVRHARMTDVNAGGLSAIAIRAIDEVGNPTILATIAVVAAILPMAFVRGMSGPYMRPIPVGASAAMAFSLAVAFVVTPWAAVRLLKPSAHHHRGEEDLLTRLYRRVMAPLIASGRRRALFLTGVAILLLAATALLPLEWVKVKMMPFDNKSEFQVIIDMPEGTALETTARVTAALASAALDDDTVINVQQYVGVSAPYNFNGLVRHYFLRRAPHLAAKWPAACASGWLRSRNNLARPSRWRNCRPARRCCRLSSPRSMGRMRRDERTSPPKSNQSSNKPPAWSIPAGRSKRRTRRLRWPSMAKKLPQRASRRLQWRRSYGWRARENPPACCTTNGRVRTCPS
jgi:multidrug efflux pump subunit AcrB